MRTKLIALGLFLFPTAAIASPSVPFANVFDSTSAFDGGGTLLGASQVVVGSGGDVFTNALLDNGNQAIIYSNQSSPGVWTSQDLVDPGTAVPGVSGSINIIDNLALSTNTTGDRRVFFAADDSNSNYGVLQLDVTSGGSTVSDVAFDGDGGTYHFKGASSVISPDGTVSLQANGVGQALFPANTAGSTGVVVRGNASSTTQLFAPTASLAVSDATLRFGIGNQTPSPTGLAELTASPGGKGVYVLSGGSPLKISGTLAPAQSGASMILGYTANASLNAALMLGQGTSGGTTQNVVLSKNNGSPIPILAGGSSSITPAAGVSALGELSPQGKIALYVPDGSGDDADTIQYADATAALPSGSIVAAVNTDGSAPASAKVALSNGTPLPIIGLQSGGSSWVPQINNNGTIIFSAEVFDASLNSNEQALVEWDPSRSGSSPVVLLETGQPVDLNGNPSSSVLDSYQLNGLIQQNDFYKNALSDDNYIGVSVNYDDGSNAVIITQLQTSVPEPATIALMGIVGVGLLSRRRRS
jgi:hypothetical protein